MLPTRDSGCKITINFGNNLGFAALIYTSEAFDDVFSLFFWNNIDIFDFVMFQLHLPFMSNFSLPARPEHNAV